VSKRKGCLLLKDAPTLDTSNHAYESLTPFPSPLRPERGESLLTFFAPPFPTQLESRVCNYSLTLFSWQDFLPEEPGDLVPDS